MQTSYCHRGGNEPLLGSTIAEHFAEVVTRFSEHEAAVSLPQQRRLSYKALSDVIANSQKDF